MVDAGLQVMLLTSQNKNHKNPKTVLAGSLGSATGCLELDQFHSYHTEKKFSKVILGISLQK